MTDFAIRLDGKNLMTGDDRSCHIVFNNLSGRNFQTRPLWQTLTHADYLAYMAAQLRVRQWRGVLTLHDATGEEIDQHEFVPLAEQSSSLPANVVQIGAI